MTSKYDEAAVDAVINAQDAIMNSDMYDLKKMSPLGRRLYNAIEALRPKPEMEAVIPEWDVFADGKARESFGGDEIMWVDGRRIYKDDFNAIREATRVPVRPKVKAGKDWSMSEIEEVLAVVRPVPVDDKRSYFRAVIDAINAKQGLT